MCGAAARGRFGVMVIVVIDKSLEIANFDLFAATIALYERV